jgi:hypothetical protein
MEVSLIHVCEMLKRLYYNAFQDTVTFMAMNRLRHLPRKQKTTIMILEACTLPCYQESYSINTFKTESKQCIHLQSLESLIHNTYLISIL